MTHGGAPDGTVLRVVSRRLHILRRTLSFALPFFVIEGKRIAVELNNDVTDSINSPVVAE